jgi:ribose/xylose/arabinose/galactoside ABC-type transport system permease subunit
VKEKTDNKLLLGMRDILLSYGFVIVMVLVFILFSVTTNNFFTLRNIMAILHTSAPLMILASGLALVVMTAKLDISVGTIMFVSVGTGVLLIMRQGVPQSIGLGVTIAIGILFGMLNGFIVVVLKVNPLIATMGTLISMRGIGLLITNSMVVDLPENLRRMGNAKIGPVYIDILVALVIVLFVHILHTRTLFGRHVMALGNGEDIAERLGVRVPRVTFLTFVLSGFFASVGGLFAVFQVGAVTPTLGAGAEFSAIALIVIGGISLFGGEGSIIPGLILGALTLTIIESGLNFMGASPYAYPFVRGAIIFIAMYADSLKSFVRPQVHVTAEE